MIMSTTCPKCGGAMERGFTTAVGLIGAGCYDESHKPPLRFTVPGTPTSLNPIKAFQQGIRDEPDVRGYDIVGMRCSGCGYLEFYAGATD